MAGELHDNHGLGEGSWSLPSIRPEGLRLGLIAMGISVAVLLLTSWDFIAWPMLAASAGVFAFFRDPERIVPQGDNFIIAPADGIVSQITRTEPPRELQGDDDAGQSGLPTVPVMRISISISVFDVHINRSAIGGTIRRQTYVSGSFTNARIDKASEQKERQYLLIERSNGLKIAMVQIAGIVARRIVPFVKSGDLVAAGQRVGLIHFGSRIDIYLPPETASKVIVGQKTVAGETILGEVGTSLLLEGIAL